ncbi:MAG: hypothetical protein AAGJ32_09110 [Pseudomonadota bacterium]
MLNIRRVRTIPLPGANWSEANAFRGGTFVSTKLDTVPNGAGRRTGSRYPE